MKLLVFKYRKKEAKLLDKYIIHVDMDAFFASVEVRDNPSLKGKPVIIGSYPNERGVVATCSYEARKYGVHSAMNIKEAYRLCPRGIYMHPNFEKYKAVSMQIHSIWEEYATETEAIALDEAYLDVTEKAKDLVGARLIAKAIKERIKNEVGLTCSVGLAYSKIAAKTASEEKKPNGYYEILDKESFLKLVIDRDVDALYTVGKKTKELFNKNGIFKVRDIQEQKEKVHRLLGKRGELIISLANGDDPRELKSYKPEEAKSISREITFQKDVDNYDLLKDILFILALCVENQVKKYGLYGSGVSLKITYFDMKTITRSKIVYSCESAIEIAEEAIEMLNNIEHKPIRLIGTGVYNLSKDSTKQLRIDDYLPIGENNAKEKTKNKFAVLQKRYNLDFEGNITKLYNMETLFKTIEYMRKQF